MSSAAVTGKAVLPEPYTILGLRLLPFSLGHFMLMRSLDCGFVGDDLANDIGITDLIIGVAVCSHTYEGFIEKLQTGELNNWLEVWGQQVENQIASDPNFAPVTRFSLFSQYMKEGLAIPDYWDGDNSSNTLSGVHWTHQVLGILVSECGYSRTEALNAPIAQSLADYFAFAERTGAIRLMSEWELEQLKSNGSK